MTPKLPAAELARVLESAADLTQRFDAVLEALEADPEFVLNRADSVTTSAFDRRGIRGRKCVQLSPSSLQRWTEAIDRGEVSKSPRDT